MKPQTFDDWWQQYRRENMLRNSKRMKEIANMGWHAAASQNIPVLVVAALTGALTHTDELREAWQRGVLDERDGQGGTRSNRNVEVNVALRNALDMLASEQIQ